MAVPKKRTSYSRKKIRKQQWLKKIVNHLEQIPLYFDPFNTNNPYISSFRGNNNPVQKKTQQNTNQQNKTAEKTTQQTIDLSTKDYNFTPDDLKNKDKIDKNFKNNSDQEKKSKDFGPIRKKNIKTNQNKIKKK